LPLERMKNVPSKSSHISHTQTNINFLEVYYFYAKRLSWNKESSIQTKNPSYTEQEPLA